MTNRLSPINVHSLGIAKYPILRSALLPFLIFVVCNITTQKARAHVSGYCTGTYTATFSPSLPSTIYYPKVSGIVVYSGKVSIIVNNCYSPDSGSIPFYFITYYGNIAQATKVLNTPGLTVSNNSPGTNTTLVSCGTAIGYGNSGLIAYNAGAYFANVTCTGTFDLVLTTNSNASSASSTTSITSGQISATSSYTNGWFGGNVSPSKTVYQPFIGALGQALNFTPIGCVATASAQTVQLPTVSVNTINQTGYTPWTTWSFTLNSCTNVSSAVTANVTFTYTELDGTGSSIIAPTNTGTGAATHVGVQVGYNGNVLATGVATSLGAMSSATSYSYTMQARYAKASGQTATAGAISGAAATYTMTYN
jgi:hypothetical protein